MCIPAQTHLNVFKRHYMFQETLGKALGVKGRVKKTRLLYMVGQTRVHVDEVEGLGNFMELEVSSS